MRVKIAVVMLVSIFCLLNEVESQTLRDKEVITLLDGIEKVNKSIGTALSNLVIELRKLDESYKFTKLRLEVMEVAMTTNVAANKSILQTLKKIEVSLQAISQRLDIIEARLNKISEEKLLE